MGSSCHSKRVGVHELRVKVGSFFREDFRKDSVVAQAPRTILGLTRSQAHCPHRFTTCRLTCLPSRLELAGSYPRGWLTKGGRWSRALFIPRLHCVLASQPEPPSTR